MNTKRSYALRYDQTALRTMMQFPRKGDFTGTLTWNGAGFDSTMEWDCARQKG